jgi:hypothetical protein
VADVLLEDRLRALGEALEFRDEDTLVDDVLGALDVRPPSRWRRPLLVAAAVVVIALTVTLAVPSSRETIARWLGFDDYRIERVDVVPPTLTVPPEPAGISLEEAADRTGVTPLVAPELGPPREIQAPLGRYVLVRYDEALVATLPGTLDEGAFGKLGTMGMDVRAVEVGGLPGYWISGGPHVFLYTDADGVPREVRAAGDTLVWERGDTIVRVEGDLTLQRALEIAATLREP